MIADKEENRINFCAAGDPAAVDGNDGVALVAADRQPEHGEDRHHGQGAGQEQQDGGGSPSSPLRRSPGGGRRRDHCVEESGETCPRRTSRLYWSFTEARNW